MKTITEYIQKSQIKKLTTFNIYTIKLKVMPSKVYGAYMLITKDGLDLLYKNGLLKTKNNDINYFNEIFDDIKYALKKYKEIFISPSSTNEYCNFNYLTTDIVIQGNKIGELTSLNDFNENYFKQLL